MSKLVEAKNISKSFGSFLAVKNISFSLKKGEILGFLGPNGAGKTTTMRLLTGFLVPDTGTILIKQKNLFNNLLYARKSIGYVPEGSPLYGEMNTIDFLNFIYDIRVLSKLNKENAINDVINLLKLENILGQRIDTLSKGFKRRVGLAQAILHNPEILILDEPTDGLDPNQKNEVRNLIKNLGKEKAIIISTHILEEVNSVCNRAMIIANGQLLIDDNPNNILKKSKSYNNVFISIEEKSNSELKSELLKMNIAKNISIEGSYCVVRPNGNNKLKNTIQKFVKEKSYTIKHFSIEKGSLEDVFSELTINE